MSIFLGIILALAVFLIVVFLHELGHFLTARWSGVKVQEFGLGLPPRMKRFWKDRRGTEWTLNWLPLGGFVRLKGEDVFAPESRDSDALPRVAWWKQVIILLAGVTMNFLLAGILFGVLLYQGTTPVMVHIRELHPEGLLSAVGRGTTLFPIFDTLEDAISARVIDRRPGVIVNPLPDSPAMSAGLQSGDVVTKIDDVTIDSPEILMTYLSEHPGIHTLTISRDGIPQTLTVMPSGGKIGAYVSPYIVPREYRYSLLPALGHGFREMGQQIGFSFRTFGAMISRLTSPESTVEQKQEVTRSVGGPVAIGRMFVGMASEGLDLRPLLIITALISISLGVFNLLPFPALDGGRVFVILVNQVIHVVAPRFKITPKIEQMIHSMGFMVLIFLSILITWKDIFMR